MDNQNNLHPLYEKFLVDQCDDTEIRRLLELFGTQDREDLAYLIRQKLEDATATTPDNADHSERYENILINLRNQIAANKTPVRRLWPRIAVAASILAGIAAGSYFLLPKVHPRAIPVAKIAAPQDVLPGKSKARLTLSDGRVIDLDDATTGLIAADGLETISKTSKGQIQYAGAAANPAPANTANNPSAFNILQTPNGGQYQVALPDGTRVWLNAGSTLKYATNLVAGKERRITLTGEAYFEVAKDAARPFIVETDDQQIRVLGTSFNVNSYHDEGGSNTTLLQGSIKAIHGDKEVLIRPGQQVTTHGPRLTVAEADTEQAIAWKNNQLIFDSQTIQQLMKQLSRWYDIDVKYTGNITDARFNGSISKFENISAVLKVLESSRKVHFRIDGHTVYVQK